MERFKLTIVVERSSVNPNLGHGEDIEQARFDIVDGEQAKFLHAKWIVNDCECQHTRIYLAREYVTD